MEQNIIEEFKAQGFYIARNLIPLSLIYQMQEDCKKLQEQYPNRCAWNEQILLRKDSFFDLLNFKPYTDIVQSLLGKDLQILAIDLRRVPTKSGDFYWHKDLNQQIASTLTINTAVYLQDTDVNAGPLYVLPKPVLDQDTIQEEGLLPDSFQKQAVPLEVKKGDVIFHVGSLWHTGAENKSDQDNWAVYPHFGHFWIKRMDRFFTSPLPEKITKSKNPLMRQLFGIELQEGAVDLLGDDPTYAYRGEEGVDYEIGKTDKRAEL